VAGSFVMQEIAAFSALEIVGQYTDLDKLILEQ